MSGRQPWPANWKIERSLDYLVNNLILSTEIVDQEWLKEEIEEWKGIQEMINESQQHEEDKVLHCTWSTDTPYLRLYHTLVDDSVRGAFGQAFSVKTREELDGWNSSLYKEFRRRRQIDSTRKNGSQIVKSSPIYMKISNDPNHYL